MAETLSELVVKILADVSELKNGLTEATHSVQSWVKGNEKQFKAVGAALTGVGASITGSLGMMTKAAIDEEINIKRLSQSLRNVGINYDDVKESLEGVILATQRKTGIADDAQRDALNELITVTGNYQTAIEWLPAALDMAAAKQMDATSAARLLGRAALGNTEMLTRYGIVVKEGATATEILTTIQGKFAGSAEATANPLNILKASMGDLAEKIGSFLIPILKNVVEKVVPIIEKIQAWTDAHPGLTKALIILATVLGGVALVLGPLLIMLPMLVAGFGLLLGPVGLVVAAVMGLIAIGTLLVLNWETIKNKTIEIWNSIVGFFSGIWQSIIGFFKDNWDKILAILFPAVGIPILIARNWEPIVDFFEGLWGRVFQTVKDWAKDVKNFLINLNPWNWIKEKWEGLLNGIKGILDKIFGHSIIEDWAQGLAKYLGNVDLKTPAEKMFGGITKAATSEMSKTFDSVKSTLTELKGRVGLATTISERGESIRAFQEARLNAANKLAAETGITSIQAQAQLGATVPEWMLQHGGIVTRPTLAMVGESGAEAVIPLNKWDMPNPAVSVTVKGNLLAERDLIRIIREELLRIKQRNFDSGL